MLYLCRNVICTRNEKDVQKKTLMSLIAHNSRFAERRRMEKWGACISDPTDGTGPHSFIPSVKKLPGGK